jgi:hypothetical protein
MAAETVSTPAIEGVKLNAHEVRSSIMLRLGPEASEQQFERLRLRHPDLSTEVLRSFRA